MFSHASHSLSAELQGCHGIQEAGSQASKTSVAQGRIRLFGEEILWWNEFSIAWGAILSILWIQATVQMMMVMMMMMMMTTMMMMMTTQRAPPISCPSLRRRPVTPPLDPKIQDQVIHGCWPSCQLNNHQVSLKFCSKSKLAIAFCMWRPIKYSADK